MTVTLPTPQLTPRRLRPERRRTRAASAGRAWWARGPRWWAPLLAALVLIGGLGLWGWPLPLTLLALSLLGVLAAALLRERALRQRAERDARSDALTGLANRRGLDRALAGALRASGEQPLSLLLLDLDHFKRINDRFGHLMGDRMLVEAARSLACCLRADDVKGRWGGEEFVVLLPGADGEAARAVAERLRQHLEARLQLGMVAVTTSIGVATCLPGDTADGLLARADGALYAAKRAGRNRTVLAGEEALAGAWN